MSALRIAIIGAGLMGRWHARYASKAGAKITGVVDTRLDAAEALSKRFAAKAVQRLDECLAEVDAIHICTGIDSHVALAEAALDAGKHVIIEKPVARTLEQTQGLLSLAQSKNRRFCPVHQFPFQRGVQQIKRNLPRLGELVGLEFVTYSAGGEGKTAVQRRSVLREIVPHPVSLLRLLLGPAEPVWTIHRFTDDDLEILGRWGGTHVRILISLRARPTRNELHVAGTAGTATADLFHGFAIIESGKPSRLNKALRPLMHGMKETFVTAANLAGRAFRGEPAYPGLGELIRRFYESIDAATEPPVARDEILAAARLMELLA